MLAALGGCSLAPHYDRPTMPAPPQMPTRKPPAAWKVATPADAAPRGQWWTRFEDPDLNDLETQVSSANQSLRAALARLDEARAETRIARASYFPTVDGECDRHP